MGLSKTSHHEFSSNSFNIIIYGIDIQELYPEFYQTLPNMDDLQQKIPDIMGKPEKNYFFKERNNVACKRKRNLTQKVSEIFYLNFI